jgi:hypothetical protein
MSNRDNVHALAREPARIVTSRVWARFFSSKRFTSSTWIFMSQAWAKTGSLEFDSFAALVGGGYKILVRGNYWIVIAYRVQTH